MNTPSQTRLFAASVGTVGLLVAVALWTQSRLGASLLPHSFCITASPPLLWLHLLGDGLIALAYLLIPWAMLNFIRQRRDVPFGWVAWLFGAFIVACGLTHAIEVWTLWVPVYWYSGVLKAFTAAVSLATAGVLYTLTPRALALPSALQLREANEALAREIETRRETEMKLREASAELQRLYTEQATQARQTSAVLDRFFEAAPVGLALLDQNTRVQRVNPKLHALSDREPREFLEHCVGHLNSLPDTANESDAAASSVTHEVEVSRRRTDGSALHMMISCFPIPIPAGPPLTGVVARDISTQRSVEQEREKALQAAEAANRAKDEFLAKVSHELRSPLQVALSSAEVLKRVPGLPEPARKHVDRLAQSVMAQSRMINDLLDLSRILSGKMELVTDLLDPDEILRAQVEGWNGKAALRNVSVELHTGAPGDLVSADPARLEQIFTNLVDNAIRFSPDGGRIAISTGRSDGHWQLRVCDRGVGIPSEDLQHIFRPFAQGRQQPKVGKGLGLGLSIVQSLVEAHGGSVRAESGGVGQGATFLVELPLASAGIEPGQAVVEDAVRLDGVRLLYVEDDVEVASAMQSSLSNLGAQVDTATSFDDATRMLQRLAFDVLVTDLNLGEGPSGHDLVLLMRRMTQHTAVPAVAVSAFGGPEDIQASTAVGFAAHLVKPVRADDVARTIRQLLRPRRVA